MHLSLLICIHVLFTIMGMKTNIKYILVGLVILVIIIVVLVILLSKNNQNNGIIVDPPTGEVSQCQEIASSYVGLSEQEATNKAKKDGLTYRVIERDGEGLMATMDYSADRINFAITNNKVTSASCG